MADKTNEEWKDVLRGINTEVNRYEEREIDPNLNQRISVLGYGDCRSFTYEKFYQMIAAGFPEDRLGPCSCEAETGEAHAVLLVQFGDELWCADNREGHTQVGDFRKPPFDRYRWDWVPSHLTDLIA